MFRHLKSHHQANMIRIKHKMLRNPMDKPLCILHGQATMYPSWTSHNVSFMDKPQCILHGQATMYPSRTSHCVSFMDKPQWILHGQATMYPSWTRHYVSFTDKPLCILHGQATMYPYFHNQYLGRIVNFQRSKRTGPCGRVPLLRNPKDYVFEIYGECPVNGYLSP